MLKKIVWIILLFSIAFFAWYFNRPQVLMVETIKVQSGLTEATVSNTRAGTVTACQRSKLSLPIGGQIESINVIEGQIVQAGTVLLTLWNKDVKAQLEASIAALRAVDYEKKRLCITAKSDERESYRQLNLFKQKLVSEEVVDVTTARANSSKAACAAADARTQQAKAIISQAQASLDKTYLTAPFDGTVAEITGEVGEFTTPSPPGVAMPPAIDLITSDCHYIKAPIDEVDAGDVLVDMPVRITLDAFRAKTFQGVVRRISPYVQDFSRQARTVEIEVEFLKQELPVLLAGYSVDVEIILASSAKGLRVPTDSIEDNKTVYVLNASSILEQREVTIGLANWQYSEIVSGLKAGESIVVSVNDEMIKAGAEAKSR